MISIDTRKSESDIKSVDGERMPLPKVLRWFWIGSVVAFGLMFLIDYLEYLAGFPWDTRHPLSDARFGDLTELIPTFRYLHTEAFFQSAAGHSPVAYPPLAAVLYALMYSFGRPVVFYLGVAAVALGCAVWGVRRALIGYGINPWTATLFPLTLVVVSFPIEGMLQRGNIELFVWIFTAAGTWAFMRDRDDAAGVLWGLAAATKLYPVLLLTLMLAKRRFRAFAVGVGSFIAASALSMLYLGPSLGVAFRGSMRSVFGYQGARAAEWSMHELAANHSTFLLVKVVATLMGADAAALTTPYYVCGGLLFLLVFFKYVRKIPVANQVLVVTAFMVMLPSVSYFYALVHLYAPFLVLMFLVVRAERAGVRIPGLTGTILLFVPIFAAFTLFTYRNALVFGGLIQGVMLISLLLCGLSYPFELQEPKPPKEMTEERLPEE